MISHLFNAYEYESCDFERENLNASDNNAALESLATDWFSPDYMQN